MPQGMIVIACLTIGAVIGWVRAANRAAAGRQAAICRRPCHGSVHPGNFRDHHADPDGLMFRRSLTVCAGMGACQPAGISGPAGRHCRPDCPTGRRTASITRPHHAGQERDRIWTVSTAPLPRLFRPGRDPIEALVDEVAIPRDWLEKLAEKILTPRTRRRPRPRQLSTR